jgi:hypothetical protein
MKVYRGPEDISILEFHKGYGSFVDFNEKTQEIKDAIERMEKKMANEKSEDEESDD